MGRTSHSRHVHCRYVHCRYVHCRRTVARALGLVVIIGLSACSSNSKDSAAPTTVDTVGRSTSVATNVEPTVAKSSVDTTAVPESESTPVVPESESATAVSETESASSATTGVETAPAVFADRQFKVNEPKNYSADRPAPLLVMLHGYTGNGASMEQFLGLQAEAETRGYLTVYPDGTKDRTGAQFWNATDACCDFGSTKVDDSAYLQSMVTDVQKRYAVNPKRIFFAGHSNGGFMSYRMACEHADTIAAIVSVAGAMNADPKLCAPINPVSVVQVHGTADPTIAFLGSAIGGNNYPSAADSIASWAAVDKCVGKLAETSPTVDLDTGLPGNDTTVSSYAGCPGRAVELWSITDGAHSPSFTPEFGAKVLDFFDAHPKP